jgi:hypothetical protein
MNEYKELKSDLRKMKKDLEVFMAEEKVHCQIKDDPSDSPWMIVKRGKEKLGEIYWRGRQWNATPELDEEAFSGDFPSFGIQAGVSEEKF